MPKGTETMTTEWMGRYREILAALVLHGNVVLRAHSIAIDIGDGIFLNHQQWQILEYIVEHRDELFNMIDISYHLNIPQSTFSKTVKLLHGYGLVEKYQAVNNRKNIILRPTEKGLRLYQSISQKEAMGILQGFFDALKNVTDEDLHAMAKAIEALDNELLPERKEEIELIKLEKQT